MCIRLNELSLKFTKNVNEETTLELLNHLEDGFRLLPIESFLKLLILDLDFPLASMGPRNFDRFAKIFSNVSYLCVDLSRINRLTRRRRLLRMLEGGLPKLTYLYILNNGRCDFSWLESSKRISTFNIPFNHPIIIADFLSFYRLAVYRDSRAAKEADNEQYRNVTVTLSLSQYKSLKKLWSKVQHHQKVAERIEYPDNLHVTV